MDEAQPKPLKPGDTIPADTLDLYLRENATEDMVRNLGYPNLKVFFMESNLADLAARWRLTHDESVLKEYHLLYYKLLAFGLEPDDFDVSTELPSEVMPELPEHMTNNA